MDFFNEALDDMMGFRITACENINHQLSHMHAFEIEDVIALCGASGIDPQTLTEEEKSIIFKNLD